MADVSVEALIGSLADTTAFNELKKRIERVTQNAKPLDTPAARVIEERALRKAQYEEAKRNVTRWQPLVKANREAPHISFSAEATATRAALTVGALTDKFEPSTSLEKEMSAAFKSMQADVQGEVDGLAALGDGLTAEEFQKRQGELAKLRALLSYHEKKRRHMNKIKSKSYRKIRKKQKLKQVEAERERVRKENPALAAKLDEAELMARAKERMTLKHRNKSKWAKHVLSRGGTANETHREALNRHVQREQELRVKMQRVTDGGSDDEGKAGDSDSDSDSGSDSDGAEGQKATKGSALLKRLMQPTRERPLLALDEYDDGSSSDGDSDSGSSGDSDSGSGSGSDGDGDDKRGARSQRRSDAAAKAAAAAGAGIRVRALASSTGVVSVSMPAAAAEVQPPVAVVVRSGKATRPAAVSVEAKAQTRKRGRGAQGDDNGHGVAAPAAAAVVVPDKAAAAQNGSKRPAAAVAGAPAASAGGAGASAKGKAAGAVGGKGAARAAAVTADAPSVQTAAAPAPPSKKARGRAAATAVASDLAVAADAAADGPAQGAVEPAGVTAAATAATTRDAGRAAAPPARVHSEQVRAPQAESRKREQEELVRRAFAGFGATVEELEQEKEEAHADSRPKEPTVLAGWGDWAGAGAAPKTARPGGAAGSRKRPLSAGAAAAAAAASAADEARKKAKASRKDGALPGVIISEKRDKKLAKFMADKIPYPFTSREQYERSLRTTIGPEWNTPSVFSELSRPEVVTRAGVIIAPIKFTNAKSKSKAQPSAA